MTHSTALPDGPLQLTMLQASLAEARHSAARSSTVRPPAARRPASLGVVAGVTALDVLEQFRFDDSGDRFPGRSRRCRRGFPRLAGGLPVHRRHLRIADGKSLPRLPECWWSSRVSPRPGLLETVFLSILNHDSAVPRRPPG